MSKPPVFGYRWFLTRICKMSDVKYRVNFSFKKMLSSLSLWLIGICINMLPILYKVIDEWFSETYRDFVDIYSTLFWSDVEFLSINFSVSFLLLLELCFVQSNFKIVNNILLFILSVVTAVLIAMYTMAVFSDGWSTHVSAVFMKSVNFWTLLSIVFLGIVYFVTSSLKITREVINNG